MKPLVIITLILLVFAAGCTTQAPKKIINTPTTIVETPSLNATNPTITVPTKIIILPTSTPVQTETGFTGYTLPARTPVPIVTKAPLIIVDPVTNYSFYSDSDFSINYPEGWEVVKDVMRYPSNRMCGENKLKPEARVVTFRSADSSLNFTAITTDFFTADNCDIKTTIDVWQGTIQPRFYDVAGPGSLTNFNIKYSEFKTPSVNFDVLIPQSSMFYPAEYSERDIVSYTHSYTFRFNGNLTGWKEVKDTMFGSLKTEERVKVVK
jgi:hypothetical protein